MSILTLKCNFIWTFAGNIVFSLCQWGVIVVIAKTSPSEMVGEFSFLLVITTPIMMLASLNLRTAQATDSNNEYCFGHYVGLRVVTTLTAFIVIVFVASFGGFPHTLKWPIVMMGIAKSIEALSDVVYGFHQKNGRMDLVSRSLILRGVSALICIGSLLILTQNLAISVFGIAMGWFVIFVFHDMPLACNVMEGSYLKLMPEWDWTQIKRLVWLTIPLGVAMMLSALIVSVPRYFVGQNLGMTQLGIFTALSYIAVSSGVMVNALAQSTLSELSRIFFSGNRHCFVKLLCKLLLFSFLIGVVVVLVVLFFGEQILLLLYTPEYALYNNLFIYLSFATGISFVYGFLRVALQAMRMFRLLMFLSLFGIMCLVGTSFYAASYMGLSGVALGMILVSLIQSLLLAGAILVYVKR